MNQNPRKSLLVIVFGGIALVPFLTPTIDQAFFRWFNDLELPASRLRESSIVQYHYNHACDKLELGIVDDFGERVVLVVDRDLSEVSGTQSDFSPGIQDGFAGESLGGEGLYDLGALGSAQASDIFGTRVLARVGSKHELKTELLEFAELNYSRQ
jgi:hypothetical protein